MILESKWKWTLAACFVLGSLYLMGSGAIQSAYSLIEDSGTPLTKRQILNFTTNMTCVDDSMNLSTDCSSSGGGGGSAGGLVTYNGGAPNSAGTLYIPVGGSTAANATEGAVQIPLAASGTASSLYVSTFAAPGSGNSYTFTLRVAGVNTSITCEISGASATSCDDTTHTATVMAGQLVDISVVTVGTAGGAAMGESMLLPAGSGGGSSITFAPPYLYNGTNYYVAATGYQATKPPSSPSFINGATPAISMAGTNGDYVYGGTSAAQYFQTQTCTTSVEAELTAESIATGGGGTGAAGIWIWDSTNSHLFDFEFVAVGGQINLEGYEFSYSGSGNPSPIGAYYGPYGAFGTEPVQHFKMAVSGGTLTISYSIDGGGSYIPVNTQSVGTIGGCGTTVLSPGVIDVLSLVVS